MSYHQTVACLSRRSIVLCVGVLVSALAGCGESAPEAPQATAETSTATEKIAAATATRTSVKPPDLGHLSMQQAVRKEPPDNALPPVATITGKSVGKLYLEVERQWPHIRFLSAAGVRRQYRATIDTDQGIIELELWPDAAPNHVRSFVALARAGYYDGLLFEEAIGGSTEVEKGSPKLVLAGSPAGDGNELASIGYWLLPEIADKQTVKHEPGIVAAGRGAELDTAGCRFYITLTDAPVLDGHYSIFGKVVRGLDVVSRIHERLAGGAAGTTVIRKVVITEQAERAVARSK